MDTPLKKNLMFLMLSNNYIGTTLYFEDNTEKIIKDIVDYDSSTHVFIVEFEDGEIMQIPDKIRYEFKLQDATIETNLKRFPNVKRKRGKRR